MLCGKIKTQQNSGQLEITASINILTFELNHIANFTIDQNFAFILLYYSFICISISKYFAMHYNNLFLNDASE